MMKTIFFLAFGLLFSLQAAPPAESIPPAKDTEPTVSAEEDVVLQEVAKKPAKEAVQQLRAAITPESSSALVFALSVYELQSGDTKAAIASLRRVLKETPRFHRARINLAKLLLREVDYEACVRELRLLLGSDAPQKNELWRLLAHVLQAQEKFLAAENAYRQALAFYPDDQQLRLGLIKSLMGQNRLVEVAPLARAEILRDPGKKEFWALLANIALQKENRKRSLILLECARRLEAADGQMLATLGDLCMDAGLARSARECYLKTSGEGNALSKRSLNGFAALVSAGYDAEAEILRKKLERRLEIFSPDEKNTFLFLSAQLAERSGKVESAEKLYRQVLTADPLMGDALLSLAELFLGSGKEGEADALFVRAARLPEYKIRALSGRARLAVERGEFPQAIAFLQEALKEGANPALQRYLERLQSVAP